jgi:hypothetical protein
MSGVHNEELLLLSYLDGELDAGRAAVVRRHLDTCQECREYLADARAALRLYNDETRAALPAPPRPWVDLRLPFNDLDAERRQLRRSRPSYQPVWWAAAAAAIAIAVFVMRLSTGATVSAAELLARASAQEAAPARIQVKTRKRSFVRAARETGDPELAAMFRNANFDWDQPLRAGAFADWRNSLSDRKDDVRVLQNPPVGKGRFYRITTSTPEGGLSQVSLTIRAADLRAVEERFQFRNSEWVEISEAPPPPPMDSDPDRPPVSDSAVPQPAVTVADEIRVLEAMHGIGADLGEPIEVRRTGSAVEVTVLGATPRREKEIREALNGLPHVVARFEQPQAVRGAADTSGQAAAEIPSGPLHSRLLQLMGSSTHVDTFTNAALETSELILARAHAIRQLADRFPEPNDAVRAITADHQHALREALKRLTEVLHPLSGDVDTQNRAAGTADARSLLGAAQRLDTLLTLALASPNQKDDPDAVVDRIRRALAELDSASAGFKP